MISSQELHMLASMSNNHVSHTHHQHYVNGTAVRQSQRGHSLMRHWTGTHELDCGGRVWRGGIWQWILQCMYVSVRMTFIQMHSCFPNLFMFTNSVISTCRSTCWGNYDLLVSICLNTFWELTSPLEWWWLLLLKLITGRMLTICTSLDNWA